MRELRSWSGLNLGNPLGKVGKPGSMMGIALNKPPKGPVDPALFSGTQVLSTGSMLFQGTV